MSKHFKEEADAAVVDMLDSMLYTQQTVAKKNDHICYDEECHSCGNYFVPHVESYQRWRDQGEPCEAIICDDCLRKGWLDWGRA